MQDDNLPWWARTYKGTWLFDHKVLQDHVTNRNHYVSAAYDHQTWQGGDVPWGNPILKVTWSFNYVVLLDYVTN